MKRPRMDIIEPELSRATRRIRATWSPSEQQRRAEEGRRMTCELGQLISIDESEPDVWAVGAPVLDDVRRLAG